VIQNFGRTWSFRPARVLRPASREELVRAVLDSPRLRVAGSRHSWSHAIVTDATAVSLERMNRVWVDRAAGRATVQGGVTLHRLIGELARHGLALANLGSIDAQTVAGAVATATHGTGRAFQGLAAQVERFELVDGTGACRTFRRGEPGYFAALTGLGCLGVVHELELAVVPAFRLRAVTRTAPWPDVIAGIDARVRGHDHVKLWWFVGTDRAMVFENDRTDAPRGDRSVRRWLRDDLLSVAGYRALLAIGKLDRRALVPRINRALTAQYDRPLERVCDSHTGFLTPSPPVHREAEWAFDAARAGELLDAYRTLLASSGHTFNFIQEIRFSAADAFWLSPAYRRDSIWLSLYNIDSDARWRDQLAMFEAFARAHGGRPHWGKEARFDAAYLDAQYEQLPAFRALARELDPQRRFVNDWAAGALRL
jgi:FAD/FMN-containing dehydrogenase